MAVEQQDHYNITESNDRNTENQHDAYSLSFDDNNIHTATTIKKRRTKKQIRKIKDLKQQIYEYEAQIYQQDEQLKQIKELDENLKAQQDKVKRACTKKDMFMSIKRFIVDGLKLQLKVALYIVLISTFVYMNIGYINGRKEIIKKYTNPKVLQHSKQYIDIQAAH